MDLDMIRAHKIRYFLTQPNEIFLIRREKMRKIWNFKGKFSKLRSGCRDQTWAITERPDQGQKIWTWAHESKLLIIPPEQSKGESLEISLWLMGKWGDVMCLSVTSFSAHTSGARGLKFSKNNHDIGGSKFTFQIFEILSKRWDSFFDPRG